MLSGSCIFLKVDGVDAVNRARLINGNTDPRESPESTIRGKFKEFFDPNQRAKNFVHASSDLSAAQRELRLIEKLLET
jgi:nucleoside diphosphate kinase